MPPNNSGIGARPRGRPPGATSARKSDNTAQRAPASARSSRPSNSSSSTVNRRKQKQPEPDSEPDAFADSQDAMDATQDSVPGNNHSEQDGHEDDEPKATIPADLLTRLLHEFFEKDGTRISKGANEAVAKYMDIFVREAIARAAVEKEGGFLEVDDLEKIAPQLLLDL